MKSLYYYASPEFLEFDHPQPFPEKLATHQLTEAMVLRLISEHAIGTPPYVLSVPRSILYEAHLWGIPQSLLLIVPVEEAENDVLPLAVADLRFRDTLVLIHARRCFPAMPLESIKWLNVKYFDEWGNAKC